VSSAAGAVELGPWVLRTCLESSLWVLVALSLERTLLRGRAAALRHLAWTAVFVRLLAPPWALPWVGEWEPLRPLAAPGDGAARWLSLAASPLSGAAWLLLVLWAAVALGLMLRLAGRWSNTRRELLAHSHPAPRAAVETLCRIAREVGLRRAPRLRRHRGEAPALLWGWRRPLIVVAARLDGEALEAALWHECVHLRRRDPLWQIAFELLHALWWFHPLLGLAKARAGTARELACDAQVRRRWGGGAERYRRALLREAARQLHSAGPRPSLATGWALFPAATVERLAALEDHSGRPRENVARLLTASLALTMTLSALGPCGPGPLAQLRDWWSSPDAARRELDRWHEPPPGEGCLTGQLVWLRALAGEKSTPR
jgi:beta-lactamase regulating signal transducer with metallopeptidase domain